MSEKTQNAFQKYIIPAILAVALIGVILWAAQQKALEVLTQPDSPLTASMLRDLEAGQRIEAEQIVGDMLHRGRAAGLDVVRLAVAWCHLQAYELGRAERHA